MAVTSESVNSKKAKDSQEAAEQPSSSPGLSENSAQIQARMALLQVEANKAAATIAANTTPMAPPAKERTINIVILEMTNYKNFIPFLFLPPSFEQLQKAGETVVMLDEGVTSIKKLESQASVLKGINEVLKMLNNKNPLPSEIQYLISFILNNANIKNEQKTEMVNILLTNPAQFLLWLKKFQGPTQVGFDIRLKFRRKLLALKIPYFSLEKHYAEKDQVAQERLKKPEDNEYQLALMAKHEKSKMDAYGKAVESIVQKPSLKEKNTTIFIRMGGISGERFAAHLKRMQKGQNYNFNIERVRVLAPTEKVVIGGQIIFIPENEVDGAFEDFSKRVDNAEVAALAKQCKFQKVKFTQNSKTEIFSSAAFDAIIENLVKQRGATATAAATVEDLKKEGFTFFRLSSTTDGKVTFDRLGEAPTIAGLKELSNEFPRPIEELKLLTAEAFESLKKSAAAGNKIHQYELGFCYENGICTTIDIQKAADNYKLAVKQNYTPAKDAFARVINILNKKPNAGPK
jgi:TPR repeat protein